MLGSSAARTILRLYFEQGGRLRVRFRQAKNGQSPSFEIRIPASDISERREIESALRALNIRSGKPFRKSRGRKEWVVPIYGRHNCLVFLDRVEPAKVAEYRREIERAKPLSKNRQSK